MSQVSNHNLTIPKWHLNLKLNENYCDSGSLHTQNTLLYRKISFNWLFSAKQVSALFQSYSTLIINFKKHSLGQFSKSTFLVKSLFKVRLKALLACQNLTPVLFCHKSGSLLFLPYFSNMVKWISPSCIFQTW